MKRDFTNDSLNELISVIEELRRTQWCELTDWFGDRYFDVKHWLGKLGVYDRLRDMDRYHKEVLDRENVTIAQLKQIYEDVSAIDSQYAGSNGITFGSTADALRVYRDYLRILSEQVVGAVDHPCGFGSIGSLVELHRNMGKIKNDLRDKLLLIAFTADTFRNLGELYKNMVVAQYETANPQYKELFDKVLSDPDLSDIERRDIKFLAYSAPEPYRSLYLQHLARYQVEVGGVSGSFYRPSEGRIYLTDGDDTFLKNPRGPYNTFFHESGHAIDDFEQGSGSLSHSFEYEGKTLHDWIVEDVRNYVEELIRKQFPELNDAQVEALLRSLNLSDDASFDYQGSTAELDGVLKRYRDKLIGIMKQDLGGDVNEAASDVFGGVTNDALTGKWGHYPKPGTNPDDYSYWYRDGKATGAQESELWAEFFAAQMTQDQAALESIRAHFPNAYKALEAMAAEMASS